MIRSIKTLATGVLLGLLACSTPEDDGTPGPETWTVASSPSLVVGELDGDSDYLFQRIASVRLMPDGGVAVADWGTFDVRVFDEEGRIVRTLGRRGEGPGEFQLVTEFRVEPNGGLSAYDARLYRLTTFGPAGQLQGTVGFVGEGGNPGTYLGATAEGEHVLGWIEFSERDSGVVTPDPMRLGRFDSEGRLLEVIAEGVGLRRFGNGPVPFTPEFHAHLADDVVYYTDGLAPTLSAVRPSGDSVATLSIDLLSLSPESAWATLEAIHEERGSTEALTRFEEVPRDLPIPAVAEVLVDSQDLFWLKHYEPGIDSRALGGWAGGRGGIWSVIDTRGRQVAEIRVPSDLILMDIRGDRLAGITRDELGVERVAVYAWGR